MRLAWWLTGAGAVVIGLAICGIAVRIRNPLPTLEGGRDSHALPGADTSLGRTLAPPIAAHPGLSGIHLLADGGDAFAARTLLARAAERTIDAQYYIWHADLTGSMLFAELRAAADRGVRVRLLLDDNNTSGLDPLMAELDRHPNIEVRLFNPFTVRGIRLLGWAVDFRRLNRRMHNKSFTVDNQVTIIGGRNVGDEYFGAGNGALFVDLDALAVGPAVADVSSDFDRYWSSPSAYPAARILPPVPAAAPSSTAESLPADGGTGRERYAAAVRTRPIVAQLTERTLPLEWARVTLISDDPAKALGQADAGKLLIARLREVLGQPRQRLGMVSGYFVPTAHTVRTLSGMVDDGVFVSVVTNSYEATDVPIVHAGYVDDREALLRAGIRLWEIKSSASGAGSHRLRGTGSTGGVPQQSGQALHAKTFTADGERLFIGSFNLDPRSARLNTELGFVIASAPLTKYLEAQLEDALPRTAYQLRLTEHGGIEWLERRQGKVRRHKREPGTTVFSRTLTSLLSRLPIQWLL